MSCFVRLALMCIFFTTVLLGGCATTQESGSHDNSRAAVDEDAIKMRQTSKGAVLSFQDLVLFDTGRSELRQESFPILDKLANILIKHTRAKIIIEGHTDNQGPLKINQKLSEARAKSVQAALLSRHVESNRLTTKGYASAKPLTSNDTAQGRQKNRRVEVVMVGENVEKLTKNNANSFDFGPELKKFFSHAGETAKRTWSNVKESISKATAN